MHPLIRSGDVVTLAPVNGEPVAVGSVVAAEAPGAGGLVVHRVVGRSGSTLLLRGDNGARADGEVPEAALIGTVVQVERGGRAVSSLPAALRRPHALLVRAGVVRRLNRLRGLAGRCVPGPLREALGRRRPGFGEPSGPGPFLRLECAVETESR
jgi:hypothetical protein